MAPSSTSSATSSRPSELVDEHGPADPVPPTLVVEDEVSDRLRQLLTLPLAFATAGVFLVASWCGSAGRLDCIRGRAEVVLSDVRYATGLTGRVSGVTRRPSEITSRAHPMAACRPRLGHGDLAAGPRPDSSDGLPRTQVVGAHRFEERQDVFGASRRPERKESVVVVRERAAAPDRDQPRIAFLRQDHRTDRTEACRGRERREPPIDAPLPATKSGGPCDTATRSSRCRPPSRR